MAEDNVQKVIATVSSMTLGERSRLMHLLGALPPVDSEECIRYMVPQGAPNAFADTKTFVLVQKGIHPLECCRGPDKYHRNIPALCPSLVCPAFGIFIDINQRTHEDLLDSPGYLSVLQTMPDAFEMASLTYEREAGTQNAYSRVFDCVLGHQLDNAPRGAPAADGAEYFGGFPLLLVENKQEIASSGAVPSGQLCGYIRSHLLVREVPSTGGGKTAEDDARPVSFIPNDLTRGLLNRGEPCPVLCIAARGCLLQFYGGWLGPKTVCLVALPTVVDMSLQYDGVPSADASALRHAARAFFAARMCVAALRRHYFSLIECCDLWRNAGATAETEMYHPSAASLSLLSLPYAPFAPLRRLTQAGSKFGALARSRRCLPVPAVLRKLPLAIDLVQSISTAEKVNVYIAHVARLSQASIEAFGRLDCDPMLTPQLQTNAPSNEANAPEAGSSGRRKGPQPGLPRAAAAAQAVQVASVESTSGSILVARDSEAPSGEFSVDPSEGFRVLYAREHWPAPGPQPTRVVAKYVAGAYPWEVHRAAERAGAAPELYAAVALPGGFSLVLMQCLDGHGEVAAGESAESGSGAASVGDTSGWYRPVEPTPEVRTAVAECIARFHVERVCGLPCVHGDVRCANLRVRRCRPGGPLEARLVDWDWAGPEGQVRYPDQLSRHLRVDGVGDLPPIAPFAPIFQAHDVYRCQNLPH